MNLEHDLRQALGRKEPPHGFADRVLTRIVPVAAHVTHTPPRWRRLALPIAASLVLLAGGRYYVQQHDDTRVDQQRLQQYRQHAQAAHDVVLALQIASEKVSAVQAKVQEMTHHERQNDY